MAVVVAAKPLKQSEDPAAILCRAIRQLVSFPVVEAIWNYHVLVDVERGEDTLRKHVHDVVVGIGTIVKFRAKRALPFLGLKHAVSIRSMKQEAFEVKFANSANPWPRFQSEIGVITNAVSTFEKTNFRVEIRTNLAPLGKKFDPAILVVYSCTQIRLTAGEEG